MSDNKNEKKNEQKTSIIKIILRVIMGAVLVGGAVAFVIITTGQVQAVNEQFARIMEKAFEGLFR